MPINSFEIISVPVADQQRVAKESKVLRRQCDAPRRAQDSGYVLKTLDEDTSLREHIDKSTLFAAIVISSRLFRVLLGIGYNQVLANNLNIVGRKSQWDTRVGESSSGFTELLKICVEYLDRCIREICRNQEVMPTGLGQSKAGENRPGLNDFIDGQLLRRYGRIPCGDGAV